MEQGQVQAVCIPCEEIFARVLRGRPVVKGEAVIVMEAEI
jgi:hypothetical protein